MFTRETVWPELAKFNYFGKYLNIFGNIFKFYLVLGKVFNSLWHNSYAFGQIFMSKYYKHNPFIWSHCDRREHLRKRSWEKANVKMTYNTPREFACKWERGGERRRGEYESDVILIFPQGGFPSCFLISALHLPNGPARVFDDRQRFIFEWLFLVFLYDFNFQLSKNYFL